MRTPHDTGVDLASNDYLGLARDPRLAAAARDAVDTWGTGSTSSALVAGTTELHTELEAALAHLVSMESALVYSSGYLANLGVITALGGPATFIVADSHCHASIVDGVRLSRSPHAMFEHNSLDEAEQLLAGRTEPRALLVVESIYSVLGDAAPLAELLALAVRYDAVLLVDEAHGIGVVGAGRGAVSASELAGHPNVIVTATLSKALGSQGGAVLSSKRVREHLINRSRSFIFDTALAPAAAAAAHTAIEIIRAEPSLASEVGRRATRLMDGIALRQPAMAERFDRGVGAVQSIRMPNAAAALSAMQSARSAGVMVGCFRPPSVPDGISRLRLVARATLTEAELDRATSVLSSVLGDET
ncbi:MAG TPA: 8-amino-7-oxononanoate synthase [Pseudolysinimonas sp.]|nr:8-amino-7-oxononanoate synthase [Pseudolysinimonas sp.]